MRAADWLLRAAGRFVRQAPGQHEPRAGMHTFFNIFLIVLVLIELNSLLKI